MEKYLIEYFCDYRLTEFLVREKEYFTEYNGFALEESKEIISLKRAEKWISDDGESIVLRIA